MPTAYLQPHGQSMSQAFNSILYTLKQPGQAFKKSFEKTYTCKKTITAAKGTKQKCSACSGSPSVPTLQLNKVEQAVEEEIVLEQEGNAVGEEEQDLAKTQELDALESDTNSGAESAEQSAHDNVVAKFLKAKAVAQMKERGVVIPEQQSNNTLKIIPKVCTATISSTYCSSSAGFGPCA